MKELVRENVENSEGLKPLNKLVLSLFNHLTARRKRHFFFVCLLMLISSITEIVSIGAVLPFLSVIVDPEMVYSHELAQPLVTFLNLKSPEGLIFPITLLFAISAIVAAFMKITSLWVQTRVAHFSGADLSIDIYEKTLYQNYSTHISRNSSDLIAGISTKTMNTVYYIILPCLNILSAACVMSFFFFSLALLQPQIAIITLAILGLIYILIILFSTRELIGSGQTVASKQTLVVKNLQEGLGGIRDVILENAQNIYVEEYKKADIPLRKALANIQIISGAPRFGIEAFAMVVIAFIAYSFSEEPGGLSSAVPVLGGLALAAQRILPLLQLTYSSWSSIRGGQATLVDVLELLDQTLPEKKLIIDDLTDFKNQFNISNLSYRYPNSDSNALEKIDLQIRKGERVGFMGETGSGKSTLLDVIMGLLEPASGTLIIDGLEINQKNVINWQKLICHVPQDIFVADKTIAENIAFGIPLDQIDFDKVKLAAERAMISEKIDTLPGGYRSIAGERGESLSGGQKQRLGIARALYKDASVIILDEATSALDLDTEKKVLDSLKDLEESRTILMVAHRLQTLKFCSRVIQLKEGRILKEGSFDEIVNNLN